MKSAISPKSFVDSIFLLEIRIPNHCIHIKARVSDACLVTITNLKVMKTLLLSIALLAALLLPSLKAQAGNPSHNDPLLKAQHPVISDIIAEISKDSLAAYMQSLVNFGTRFQYADNRRQVAEFIAGKFRSFGYTDVALDSFKIVSETIPADSIWQYNVVATAHGTSAPDEIYLISAHHDDYMNPDPHQFAPGADDNASGVATALEIARVFKVKGFEPAATIRFITWAAEELTYYANTSGSIDYAKRMALYKEDIRLVLCNDMVANTSDTAYLVDGSYIQGSDSWTGALVSFSEALYTTLEVIPVNYPVSDNYRFRELGFPSTGFMDYILTPYYHTINDSVSNCNMDFCREVVKANCAILLNEQLTPLPQDPFTTSGKDFVTLSWKKTLNQNVKGFKIYRSSTFDTVFSLIAQIIAPADSYKDTNVVDGVLYTYYVTSMDALSYESIPSMQVHGAVTSRNKELLVVKDSKGGFNNPPDSLVDAFYQYIFSDIEHDFSDASVADSLNLAMLGRYQRIFWLSNTYSDQPNSSFRRTYNDITTYVKDGGQLFIAGFNPTYMIAGNKKYEETYVPEDTLWRFYRIQKVERKPNAALNGAVPVQSGYDTLRIDPAKCMTQLAGHVINVECIHPLPKLPSFTGSTVITTRTPARE